MDYVSTRNKAARVTAAYAIANGIASDGGLYCPTGFPALAAEDWEALAGMDYKGRDVYKRQVQRGADRGKVLVRAQAAVHLAEIAGVVAVAVGFKKRGKIYGVAAKLGDVLRPAAGFPDAGYGLAIVDARRAAEADRIDLIEYAFISPHRCKLLSAPSGDIVIVYTMDAAKPVSYTHLDVYKRQSL